MDEPTSELKYLAIKNWRKYQGTTLTHSNARRPWVKDWLDKDADPDYSELTCLQRYVLDGVRRLRGRFECNPPADGVWIARALSVDVRERHCIPSAIRRLVALGFLIPTNQRFDSDSQGKAPERGDLRGDDLRGDDLRGGEVPPGKVAPATENGDRPTSGNGAPSSATGAPLNAAVPEAPQDLGNVPGATRRQETANGAGGSPLEGLSSHQLARGMMDDLGIPGGQNDLAVWSRAIELKSRTAGIPLLAAYQFILEKAREAKTRGEFTRPIFWMKDAAYDHKPPRSSKNEQFRERVNEEFAILDRQTSRSSGS